MAKIIVDDVNEAQDLNEEVLRKTTGGIKLAKKGGNLGNFDIQEVMKEPGRAEATASSTPQSQDSISDRLINKIA